MTKGFDVIKPISTEEAEKVKQTCSFFIGSICGANGQVDVIGIQNKKNAREAGFAVVDGSVWPNQSGSPVSQISSVVNALEKTKIGTLWIIIQYDEELKNWEYGEAERENHRILERKIQEQENRAHEIRQAMPMVFRYLELALANDQGRVDMTTFTAKDSLDRKINSDLIRFFINVSLNIPKWIPMALSQCGFNTAADHTTARSEIIAQKEACFEFLNSQTLEVDCPRLEQLKKEIDAIEKKNRKFIINFVRIAEAKGFNVGIHTTKDHWEKIVGDWDGMKGRPLWYSNYDGQANFNDFVPFGVWNSPTIKQYAQNVAVDGVEGINLNYRV